jgi:hypothetical protein
MQFSGSYSQLFRMDEISAFMSLFPLSAAITHLLP